MGVKALSPGWNEVEPREKSKSFGTLERVKDKKGSIPAPISGLDKVWDITDQGFRFAPPMAKILDPSRVTLTIALYENNLKKLLPELLSI